MMRATDFDLDRYLSRLGLDAPHSPDLRGLSAVQAAQLQAVPFENFDVLLRDAVDLNPAAIFSKLVERNRGGYCFECNLLLRDALRALGFEARVLLGRVVLDRVGGPVPARTHAIVEVQLAGTPYVVDCGFGARTPRAPLMLEDGAEGGGCRVQDDAEFGWRMLQVTPGEPPRFLYVFDRARVYPSDIAIGNHWTSTHPSSHFTQRPLAVRHTRAGRIALDGRRLLEYTAEGIRTHPIDDQGRCSAQSGSSSAFTLTSCPKKLRCFGRRAALRTS